MQKRQKHFTLPLTPAVGQNSVSGSITLNGYVESMCVYSRKNEEKILTGETAAPYVFMSLQDDSNGDIVPFIHIDNFKPSTGGEYRKSFKPLGFVANNETFYVSLKTERNSVGDLGKDVDVIVCFFMGDAPLQTVVPTQPATPVKR